MIKKGRMISGANSLQDGRNSPVTPADGATQGQPFFLHIKVTLVKF